MNKLGLIAGNRNFPLLFSSKAKKKNPSLKIIAVAVKGETSSGLSRLVDKIYWVSIGRLQELIDIFLKEEIKTLVMAGQISPFRIFRDSSSWDGLMQKVVQACPDFRPHGIFTEIIKEIEKHGLKFISSITYLEEDLAKSGINNGVASDASLAKELDYVVSLVRKIVDLDIGQTVVFKDKAIVAVEALEGTDNTIKRAYGICGKGFTVIKLARKDQDLRFDVPVVGLNTIKLLGKLKAKVLVLEKDKTLILDKEKVLSLACKANIPIVGV
ncbi:MAG: UDP-2,3-diacylglucosamine diphosphatase LpxI [Candidatus Omnitrophica bacterium]|nr:UDP-2,3-diacylglucosamine diphosphatase LpxI [Candidatus Omnitrophota bacterium]